VDYWNIIPRVTLIQFEQRPRNHAYWVHVYDAPVFPCPQGERTKITLTLITTNIDITCMDRNSILYPVARHNGDEEVLCTRCGGYMRPTSTCYIFMISRLCLALLRVKSEVSLALTRFWYTIGRKWSVQSLEVSQIPCTRSNGWLSIHFNLCAQPCQRNGLCTS